MIRMITILVMKNLIVLGPLRTLIFVVVLDVVCFAFCLALDKAMH